MYHNLCNVLCLILGQTTRTIFYFQPFDIPKRYFPSYLILFPAVVFLKFSEQIKILIHEQLLEI